MYITLIGLLQGSRGGRRYFVIFIDEYSKYYYIYLLKTKLEVLDKFKIRKAKVENQR